MLLSLSAAGLLILPALRAEDKPEPNESQKETATARGKALRFKTRAAEDAEPADQAFEIIIAAEADEAGGGAPGTPPVPVPPVPASGAGRVRVLPFPIPGDAIHARALAVRKFFLGLQLGPLPDVLKSQMKLEDGVVVLAVVPESPAAKAGVEVHDIVVKAGDKSLKQPEDLVAFVEESKGKEVELHLLRGGKERTATIKPGNAPAEFNVPVSPPEAPQTSRFFVRPGVVLKAPSAEHYAIPHDMAFKINKEGDAPAKIVITHDGKTYETTADKLDVLPEKIRPHIERMLGGKEAGAIDLDVLIDRGQPGVRLEVESKNIDETLDKWLPGAQALLKEAAEHQQQGRAIEEALRRAMVFAQRRQADVRATTTGPAPAASQVESKLDEVLKKLEEVQNRLKALEAAK
jgi:hypothetical protein